MSTHLTATMTPPILPADMATAALRGEEAKRAILAMIDALAAFKMSPSYRDIARATGLAKSSVEYHVEELRQSGVLAAGHPLRRLNPPTP